jgi:tricarballylate dehydrogenase
MHDEPRGFSTGVYPFDELWSDLCGVGDGPANEDLARLTVRESEATPEWMEAHGVRWQRSLTGTLHLDRTNLFFLGGGKALLNGYYREIARRPGVCVAYDAMVEQFELTGSVCQALIVSCGGRTHRVRTGAVVAASGGFEANREWLKRYSGPGADNYIIRGTPYNDGHILAQLLDAGAGRAGQERGFHAIALDARSPRYDGGIATRLDTVPFGIAVNRDGQRFADEGEDSWPKRYATWGRRIADQPGQLAMSLWDAKVNGMFLPPLYGFLRAETVGELAALLDLDGPTLEATVAAYNVAVQGGHFDHTTLDDCHTEGLTPPKSHWAQRLDTPPYYGVPMRPGITFTYMGLEVRPDARVARADGDQFENVYAAGEIMSGNILSTGYLAGFGMTIGTVWGRRAGRGAAGHAA